MAVEKYKLAFDIAETVHPIAPKALIFAITLYDKGTPSPQMCEDIDRLFAHAETIVRKTEDLARSLSNIPYVADIKIYNENP